MSTRMWKPQEDYEVAVGWWREHGKPESYIPDPRALPRAGLVVEDQTGTPLCMGWMLVFLDVPGAYLGYLVANPQNTPRVTRESLLELIREFEALADRQNLRLLARYDDRSILNLLYQCGWAHVCSGLSELMRDPQGGVQ